MGGGLRRSIATAAVGVALALLTDRAGAAPATYGLSVASTEATCPDAAAITAAIRSVSGRDMTPAEGASRFVVTFARREEGFRASVASPSGGVRELDAVRCVDLLDAVAAVVVLALDPVSESAEVAVPASAADGEARARAAEASAAENEGEIRVAVALRVWAVSGFGPFVPGVIADYEIRPTRSLSMALGFGAIAGRSEVYRAGEIALGLWALHLEGCFAPHPTPIWIGGCLELVGGVRTVQANGYADARSAVYPAVGPGAGVRVAWPIVGGLALDGELGALVPLPRYSFPVDHGSFVQRDDIVAISARLGLRYLLP